MRKHKFRHSSGLVVSLGQRETVPLDHDHDQDPDHDGNVEEEMEFSHSHSVEPSTEISRQLTRSRLPTHRFVVTDLLQTQQLLDLDVPGPAHGFRNSNFNSESKEIQDQNTQNPPFHHTRNKSEITIHDQNRPRATVVRHLSFPIDPSQLPPLSAKIQSAASSSPAAAAAAEAAAVPKTESQPHPQSKQSLPSSPTAAQDPRHQTGRRKLPTSNKKSFNAYPPLSMITRGYMPDFEADSTTNSTTTWVAQQSMSLSPTTPEETSSPGATRPSSQSQPVTASTSRPLIKPIRGFKPSSRKSVEMSSRRASQQQDPDSTLRALEGFSPPPHRNSSHIEQEEQNSDESDLFLRAAREEEMALSRQNSHTNGDSPSRSDSRRSRIGQRASLPPSSTTFNPSISRRRGSDHDDLNGTLLMDGQDSVAQALTYRPRDRPSPLDDVNRTRYSTLNSRSTPTTPRGTGNREISPESQASYGGRRPSVPDNNILPSRSSYRQSNLSYTTPRTFNSSPLVSRTTDMHETPETKQAAEGTESTVSTTAPSTVWDELEDLKSRIHRLELTGKLPATSGAAMSRASHDRPPTATTTVTTLSSSPKRGRGNSTSPVESAAVENPPAEAHPLLHAALAKSKTLLDPEVYNALEATTKDALSISSMMGTSGQPGPISSSQSTIGGAASVSDRQVRRKAESLCRSLTELCLALSEVKNEAPPASNKVDVRPSSRDSREAELRPTTESNNTQRQLPAADLARVTSSPRALSRLEARRSSLLATSALPSPRYAPSELGTPTQSSLAGRRTSLLLRGRRAATEEPEEEDDMRFRAPSRANTEIGRTRNSLREYTSHQPLPERTSSIQSALPVRRHYASTSLTNTLPPPTPPVSNLGGRRYLDRSTPERDTTSVVGRLAEDRGQRKSSLSTNIPLGRTGSLTRRARQPTNQEMTTGQPGGYQ